MDLTLPPVQPLDVVLHRKNPSGCARMEPYNAMIYSRMKFFSKFASRAKVSTAIADIRVRVDVSHPHSLRRKRRRGEEERRATLVSARRTLCRSRSCDTSDCRCWREHAPRCSSPQSKFDMTVMLLDAVGYPYCCDAGLGCDGDG